MANGKWQIATLRRLYHDTYPAWCSKDFPLILCYFFSVHSPSSRPLVQFPRGWDPLCLPWSPSSVGQGSVVGGLQSHTVGFLVYGIPRAKILAEDAVKVLLEVLT